MKYKQFGKTTLEVSEIGFGCARLGGFLQNAPKGEAVRSLKAAQEAGITFYDTADMYAQGESEMLVGEAFRRNRDKVIIASKGGYILPTRRKAAAPLKSAIKKIVKALGIQRKHLPSGFSGSLSQNFSPEYLKSAIESSLRRLKTDYIDVYQLHSPSTQIIVQGDFIEALEILKSEGKIRFYGISCETHEDVSLCLKYPGVSSVQIGVGALDQEAITHAIPQAAESRVAVIGRGCFGGGLLNPALGVEALQETTLKWLAIMELRRIAERNRRSILELALQFSLSMDAMTVTLLGMRTQEHVSDNLRFATASPLSPEELSAVRALLKSPSPVNG